MRKATIERNTAETRIALTLELDGEGKYAVKTGCGFLNHMLELFARHGNFDLELACEGDTDVDFHHTTEDIGIALGRAFDQALGERRGIRRYGSVILPMDEALVLAAVDISGRPALGWDLPVPAQKVGDFDTELAEEFFWGFCRKAEVTLDFIQLAGKNTHHIIECAFKAFARALRAAVKIDESLKGKVPSSKGAL